MKVSVVIPVYNEKYTIRQILKRVLQSTIDLHQILIVDDGSTDGTTQLLKDLQNSFQSHPPKYPVEFIYQKYNRGKGSALRSGFKKITGDVVVIQDADLEYDPKEYPRLIQPILDGKADAVYGSRFMAQERNVPFFWHMVANKILTTFCNICTNFYLTDVWTGFKVFKTDLIKSIPIESERFGFESEITVKISKLGFRVYETAIPYNARSYVEGKKVGLLDALAGFWTIISTSLWGDLGEFAIEQAQIILNNASRYNRLIYETYATYLGEKVIEVGSASGNNAKFLLDREKLVLTDVHATYVELLKYIYRDWDNIQVGRLDITNLNSFTGNKNDIGTFDSVVCLNVIEHLKDDDQVLTHLKQLLRIGGTGVFLVPAHQAIYGTMDSSAGHFKRYEQVEFQQQLERLGFEVLSCNYFNPVAVAGWWFNGKILRREVIPSFQIILFDKLTFLIRWLMPFNLPFGISLIAITKRKV